MSSKRCSYTTGFKLKVIEAAECIRNRGASREYGLNEANVRLWRKNKNTLQECR